MSILEADAEQAAEREWIHKNYRSGGLNAYAIYRSVPWTLNNQVTLSPGHGKGLDLPYTLEKIKEIGGCCMDQAYFTENVFRLFGVPAVYTRGRGRGGGMPRARLGPDPEGPLLLGAGEEVVPVFGRVEDLGQQCLGPGEGVSRVGVDLDQVLSLARCGEPVGPAR